jgi:hypothetical protein
VTLSEAEARYGAIVGGVWADAGKWVVKYIVPPDVAAVMINTTTKQPTTHIYVNKDICQALDKAFGNVIARGLLSQLKSFDGCFEIRSVRGFQGSPSCHCYALALDINAAENALGTPGSMSPELVACFTDAGFDWGGNFTTRQDPMHFSLGWEGPTPA